MSLISSLSIKAKVLSIAAIAIVGFVVSLLINFNMNTANTHRLQQIQNVFFPVVEASKANSVYLARIEELFSTAVSTGEMDFVNNADRIEQSIQTNFQTIQKLWPEQRTAVNQIKIDFENYYKTARELSVHMVEGTLDPSAMGGMVERMNSTLAKTRGSIESFSNSSLDSFNQTVADSNEAAAAVQKLSLIVALVILGVMMAYAWAISRSINTSLHDLLTSLKGIASGDGDLTSRIKKSTQDEIGEVVDWFNQFIDKLHRSIGELVKSSHPLMDVSDDLHALTTTTTQMTEQQSRSTEEVALVVDDMVSSMKDVSTHASHAAQAAREADAVAKEGSLIVNETVSSIHNLATEVERAGEVIRQLEADTTNVGAILDVIRGIAEQTNLLALNAAIEAARAGEQGRGFAVVADEVRTLASRTQESTKQIQTVIEQLQTAARSAVNAMSESKEKASASVTQAARTGESLVQITNKVESILAMNNQIAAATDHQEQSAQSIKDNVMGIKTTSAEAMTSMQKVEASSSALKNIAKTLRNVTGQFRV